METVIAPEGAFLAALKGESDVVNGKQVGLQVPIVLILAVSVAV